MGLSNFALHAPSRGAGSGLRGFIYCSYGGELIASDASVIIGVLQHEYYLVVCCASAVLERASGCTK